MASNSLDDDGTLQSRLAIDRTALSLERTLLSYVRTSVMLIVSGATALKFFADSLLATVSGWSLIALGLATGLFGGARFAGLRRELKEARRNPALALGDDDD